MTRAKNGQFKKKLWHRLWGDASLLSRAVSVVTLISVLGAALGFIVGWFDGCRDKFEENPKNKQQDISIQELRDSMESFNRFRFHQRKKNGQYDSLFELMDLYRDNDSH